jgi:hypothetical protein
VHSTGRRAMFSGRVAPEAVCAPLHTHGTTIHERKYRQTTL